MLGVRKLSEVDDVVFVFLHRFHRTHDIGIYSKLDACRGDQTRDLLRNAMQIVREQTKRRQVLCL